MNMLLLLYCNYCLMEAATGLRGRGEQKEGGKRWREGRRGWGSSGAGGAQPRNVQDRAVQQVGGEWGVPLRRALPVCPRHRRAPARYPPSPLQDRGLPHDPHR